MPRPRRRRATLGELAAREDRLHEQVEAATGTPAARDAALERAGVYHDYAKIFRAYVRRSGTGAEGTEALRRATFLAWCAATLPNCLTGVDELAESEQAEVVAWLDDLCAEGGLDPQLAWMLGHYHARCPAALGRFAARRALQEFLLHTAGGDWRAAAPDERDFEHRGLMGRYWRSVLQAG
jgi:hypothetical protein